MRSKRQLIPFAAAVTVVFGFLAIATPVLAASKEKVPHNFHGNGKDGSYPLAGVIFDAAGNLYGTTFYGGSTQCAYDTGCGTIFQLTSENGRWKERVLYSFGFQGCEPAAGLILDSAGNLYGTTDGYDCDNGTVFQLAPRNGGWTYTVFHRFTGGSDGSVPTASLIFDAAGNLYGTTAEGGTPGFYCSYGCGTAFKLTPGTNGKWKETVLHSFTNKGNDGSYPQASLIFDAAGNLYGTTWGGGGGSGCSMYGCGTVFELSPGTNGKWKEKVLHTFNHNGKDGYNPQASLIFDAAGNLYGTTESGGGASCYAGNGCGIVFELSPGANGKWTEKVLHFFRDNGKDGIYPYAGVAFDAAGNLYGTTIFGGAYGSGCNCGGTVFKLAHGTNGQWTEKVLHSFGNGTDGEYPEAGLILDPAGNLYGSTAAGGSSGTSCGLYGYSGECGIIFEITP